MAGTAVVSDPLDLIDPAAADAPERIDRACRELGFFRIPLDVLDRSIADSAWDDAIAFFDSGVANRQAVVFPESG